MWTVVLSKNIIFTLRNLTSISIGCRSRFPGFCPNSSRLQLQVRQDENFIIRWPTWLSFEGVDQSWQTGNSGHEKKKASTCLRSPRDFGRSIAYRPHSVATLHNCANSRCNQGHQFRSGKHPSRLLTTTWPLTKAINNDLRFTSVLTIHQISQTAWQLSLIRILILCNLVLGGITKSVADI